MEKTSSQRLPPEAQLVAEARFLQARRLLATVVPLALSPGAGGVFALLVPASWQAGWPSWAAAGAAAERAGAGGQPHHAATFARCFLGRCAWRTQRARWCHRCWPVAGRQWRSCCSGSGRAA